MSHSERGTIVVEASGEQSAVVVLMHGLGDTAEGWFPVARMWAPRLPHVKFVLPTAATQPVSLNGGMRMPSWYDITGINTRANEQAEGIEASVSRVRDILAREHAAGTPYGRMVLAGFSQGGAMSLFTGLQQPAEQQLAGVLAMSGYLVATAKFAITDAGRATRALHCHGTADEVVPFEIAEHTARTLDEAGAAGYELRRYSGLAHSTSNAEMHDAVAFLAELVPPTECS